jgi:hypothetical protein
LSHSVEENRRRWRRGPLAPISGQNRPDCTCDWHRCTPLQVYDSIPTLRHQGLFLLLTGSSIYSSNCVHIQDRAWLCLPKDKARRSMAIGRMDHASMCCMYVPCCNRATLICRLTELCLLSLRCGRPRMWFHNSQNRLM